MIRRTFIATLLLLASGTSAMADTARPIVIELFTSQGCSSCPAADALLGELAKDDAILPLSLHVHYWDYLGWKDPFSSEANTLRQRAYVASLNERGLYTPHMVVDGKFSVIGSDRSAVAAAIRDARKYALTVPLTLTPDHTGQTLAIRVGEVQDIEVMPDSATLYALRYTRQATTDIPRGENRGRRLVNLNNVTHIDTVAVWNRRTGTYPYTLNLNPGEGVAILLQSNTHGRIIGAARFETP